MISAHSKFARSIIISIAAGLMAATASAADWAGWRGPDGVGISQEKDLPVKWTKDEGLAWHTLIPGRGASSPIIVGSRVYITSQTDDKGLHVIALERASGKGLWDKEINRGALPANKLHNMATPTPVSDGKLVWAQFGTGDLVCLDSAGKVVWQRNLVKDYGEYKFNHGYGSSPMLRDGRLFIVCMHQGPSYVMALDAKTGTNVWKKERNLAPKDEAQDSYSSPIFVRTGGRTELVLAGAESVNAYNLSNGEELWNCNGFKVSHPYGRTIAGLATGDGVVVTVASGFQNRGFTTGLKLGGKGDITATGKMWTNAKFAPDCPTPVVYDGKVYCIRDDGLASCLNVKTGEAYWQERVFSENVKVSPVAGDGKIYFMSGQGNCVVVKAGEKFEILSRNELNEPTLSTPSIGYKHIFIRTDGNLYCVKK